MRHPDYTPSCKDLTSLWKRGRRIVRAWSGQKHQGKSDFQTQQSRHTYGLVVILSIHRTCAKSTRQNPRIGVGRWAWGPTMTMEPLSFDSYWERKPVFFSGVNTDRLITHQGKPVPENIWVTQIVCVRCRQLQLWGLNGYSTCRDSREQLFSLYSGWRTPCFSSALLSDTSGRTTVLFVGSCRATAEPSKLAAQWNRWSQDCSQSIGTSRVQIRE